MASPLSSLRREEAAGLAIALVAHAGLVAWLTLRPADPAPLPPPQRMTVTFTNDVALKSTSPKPAAKAAAAIAPVLSPNPVPEPAPAPKPVPQPVAQPAPQPLPPRPVPKPAPPPPKPQPAPKPVAQPPKPQPAKAQPTPAKPTPQKAAPAKAGGGGSRLGSDFLKGLPGGQTPGARDTTPPAGAIGPAVRSALSGSIARQLKPKWAAPQGAEADQLVTVLAWDLNPDGTLAGAPRLVSQAGITDANRAQAQRHVEQAIRAVRLAAPFDLPAEYYAAWKHVAQFRFDRKLSQ